MIDAPACAPKNAVASVACSLAGFEEDQNRAVGEGAYEGEGIR